MARDLETIIRISGNLDATLRDSIQQAVRQVEELNGVARQASDAFDAVSSTIDAQGDALQEAQKQYANYVLSGEEGTEQAQELAERIQQLSQSLKANKAAMAAAERAAQQLADGLDDAEDAARQSADAVDALNDTIESQSDELKKAKKQYAAYVLSGEKSSDQAKALARRIGELSQELSDNRTRMRGAEEAADRLAGGLDDVDDAARGTEGGFTVMKGALADLVSSGIQRFMDAGMNAVTSVYGLAESTREYREDMGKLETAWESAGKSTELATEIYKDFYSVLGEEDRSVEAVNHLAKFVDTEQDMAAWTDIATGVWGTFGDSLPIEGLTEAANETAKVGDLTGVLADALNWAGVNEDDFQKSLDACANEQERAALITETLSSLYGEAADNYRENNAGIIEARKATSDYTDSMAELGERIEPVTAAVQTGLTRILDKALELTDSVDFGAFADKIGDAFDVIVEDVIPVVVDLKDDLVGLGRDGIAFVRNNASWLIPVLGGLTAGFAAYKTITLATSAASKAAAIAEGIKTAVLASGATTVTAATVATWAFNSAVAFLTSPVTIAVAAIAALTAGVIWLYNNWDTAREKLLEFGANCNEVWTNVAAWVTGAIDTIGQYFPIFGGYLSGWWSSIQDVVGNVQAIFGGLIDFIGNVFAGNWSAAWQNIVDIFGNVFGMIGNIAKAPINGVIGAVNAVINGINSVGFTIPDWVPVVGGKAFSISIPNIPMLAKGGFTDGVSIAGEAGTEAVISFDRSVREANLGYWAQAGRLLGATADDAGFALSGEPSGTTVIDMGGVTFAPSIEINGKQDKESVIKAIEDEYPEFLDMLENWLLERGVTVYA